MAARGYSGVNLYGPLGVISGVGSASRGYLGALRAAAVPVCVVPVHELFVHQPSVGSSEHRQWPRHPIRSSTSTPIPSTASCTITREAFRCAVQDRIWVWELPALRDEWWSEFRHFDEIWVPSTFCQRAVQAMTTKPVMVMPHVVSADELPAPASREELQIGHDEFVFLYAFDASSEVERKNPRCLVDAFEAEFSEHDRVQLMLKVSNAEDDPELSGYLDALVERNSRCVVLRQTMETDKLLRLVRGCNCYVSPHRSEGFGLTVAEAMVLGLPVIATDYGGTADFVTEDVDFPSAIVWWKSIETTAHMPKGQYGRIRHANTCGNCCVWLSRSRTRRPKRAAGPRAHAPGLLRGRSGTTNWRTARRDRVGMRPRAGGEPLE